MADGRYFESQNRHVLCYCKVNGLYFVAWSISLYR